VAAGMVLIAKPIMMAVTSPVGGKLSDRFSPGIIASIEMMITTLSLFSLTFLSSTTSINYIIIILVIQGIGISLFSSPNTNAIMSSVDKKFFGHSIWKCWYHAFNGSGVKYGYCYSDIFHLYWKC